jgi:hypothetical protein
MACVIMGDSIAVGIHAQAPSCAMLAHKGWTSARWHQRYRTLHRCRPGGDQPGQQ